MKRTVLPVRCPSCGSRDFEAEPEANDEEMHESCGCSCGYLWTNIYEFAKWLPRDEDDEG